MSIHKSLPPLPLKSNTPHPRLSSHCTHQKLTRIYDEHDSQRCSICHRIPDLGYLYRCTSETNGNLPISEFVDEDLAIDLGTLNVHHGSPTNSSFASAYPTRNAFSTINAIHSEGAIDPDMATDQSLARAHDGKRKFEAAFPPVQTQPMVNCELKICHACRPMYRERAWQSLNHVLNGTPIFPLQYEFENRRISNASTIKRMRPSGMSEPEERENPHTPQGQQQTTQTEHGVDMRGTGEDTAQHTGIASNSSAQKSTVKQHPHHTDSGSDADDEQGLSEGNELESSTTDDGECSASHSELEDLLTSHHSNRSPCHHIASEISLTPSDLESKGQPKDHGTARGRLQGKRCDHGTNRSAQSGKTDVDNGRPYHGRFEID